MGDAARSSRLERTALLVVMVSCFLTPFTSSSINLAIPSMGTELDTNATMMSWVVTAHMLGSATFLLPFGRLADITGRKRIFVAGTALFALASLLCALARSAESLVAFRVFQGIAASMTFGTANAMLISIYPPERRGKVLGLTTAATYIGLSVGPVLGGLMNQRLGWRSIFYLGVVLAALIVIGTLAFLRGEWTGAKGERFDLGGSILYSMGIALLFYSLSSISSDVSSRYRLVIGFLLMVAFVRYETRLEHPLIHVELFSKNIAFAFSNLAAMINYSATAALSFVLSLHLQLVSKLSSERAGLILLVQPAIMAALSPVTGALSDRIEPRVLASTGMGLTTVGLFFFVFLGKDTPLWLIAANLALIGLGFSLFSSPNTNAVMRAVEKRYYGIASSSLATMRNAGQTVSMAIVTLLMAMYLGDVNLADAPADSLVKTSRVAFLVFGVICAGGIFASMARGNINTEKDRSTGSDSSH